MTQTPTPEKHCPTCRCGVKKRRSGLKRDAADVRWSKMVRERAGMRCQYIADPSISRSDTGEAFRCEMGGALVVSPQGLHAAHCYTRGNPRTRLDPDNGLAMCWPHHREIDGDKSLRYAIFTWWLGAAKFDELSAKANARRDRISTKQPRTLKSDTEISTSRTQG